MKVCKLCIDDFESKGRKDPECILLEMETSGSSFDLSEFEQSVGVLESDKYRKCGVGYQIPDAFE